MKTRILIAGLLMALAGSAAAATRHVPWQDATLQAAIAAASPGDTIEIAAGTYLESGQIVLSKNLTIVGCGAGATRLQTDSNTTQGGNVQSEAWIYVAPSVTVKISNLRLDATGKQVHHAVQSRAI